MTFEFEITCECGSEDIKFVSHNDAKGVPLFKCNECGTIDNFNRFLYEIKSSIDK